MLQIANQAH